MTALPPLLQGFFAERLIGQRDASQHTIAAYRDSFRLLLGFVHERTRTAPSNLLLEDLDDATISAFLVHLEHTRANSVRTRNARLTAIRSFFHYAALKAPEQAELIGPRPVDPRETVRHDRHQLPHRSRDHRAAPSAGPIHLGWPT